MSLTSALDDRKSPVAKFFAARFPNVRPLQKAFRELIAGRETLRPIAGPDVVVPWGPLGAAFDYRLRYYFADLNPFQTVAFSGLGVLSSDAMLAVTGASGVAEPGLSDRWTKLMVDFLASLRRVGERTNPAGRRLPRQAEDLLNRHCYILALLEAFFRVGPTLNSPLYALPEKAGIEELLAVVDPWRDDLRGLSWGFFGTCQDLLGRDYVLNPTFAGSGLIGGADGDLIVDRCLIEVKTTTAPALRSQLLYQMLGYVLLDFDDRYALDEVGVYMSRQSALVRWRVEEFLEALAGEPVKLAKARTEFEVAVKAAGLQISWADLLETGRPIVFRSPQRSRELPRRHGMKRASHERRTR